jgi:hypothetical protein
LLLFRIDVLKQLGASFSASKPLSQLRNLHGPLLRLRLRFLSLFKGTLLRNFNKIVERELLIVVAQELEDTFSIAGMNLCS